jgi:hypothetical protein
MSTVTAKRKARARRKSDVNQQIAQGKALLRQLRETLEDLEDRQELIRAKKRDAGKPGVEWNAVKKEFGWRF